MTYYHPGTLVYDEHQKLIPLYKCVRGSHVWTDKAFHGLCKVAGLIEQSFRGDLVRINGELTVHPDTPLEVLTGVSPVLDPVRAYRECKPFQKKASELRPYQIDHAEGSRVFYLNNGEIIANIKWIPYRGKLHSLLLEDPPAQFNRFATHHGFLTAGLK